MVIDTVAVLCILIQSTDPHYRISGTIDDFLLGSKQMTGRVFSRHLIQPVDAQISGGKALVVSYGHVVLRAAIGDSNEEYEVFAWGWWYHRACRVTLSDGSKDWKLTSMRYVYDRDSLVSVEPCGAATLQRIKFDDDARRSYKYLGWMLTQLNYPFSKTLAGTDQPSTVAKLREEEEAWLNTRIRPNN